MLIQLYQHFISDFESRINQLKLAHFAVIVSRQYKDKDSAINFMENVIEKLEQGASAHTVNEPAMYCRMQIAAIKLQTGDHKGCKILLDEAKQSLEGITDVDTSVHSSVHWVSSQYHKSQQDFAEFYRSALLYLSYTSIDTLAEPFKLVWICLYFYTSIQFFEFCCPLFFFSRT